MKNLVFKLIFGILALSVILYGYFETQKPDLQIKQNTLIFSSNEEVRVKNVLVNDGKCEILRYVLNEDKFWDNAVAVAKTEDPVMAQYLQGLKITGMHKMMIKEQLDKSKISGKVYSVEPLELEREKALEEKSYDSAFPKVLLPNKLAKYQVNCESITKVELLTDKDNFTYEIQQ